MTTTKIMDTQDGQGQVPPSENETSNREAAPKVYAYIRVSTDRQEAANQRFELEGFAKRNGFKIDRWIEEQQSGGKDYKKRKLYPLMRRLKRGDRLICSEVSRLGRTLMMIMEILQYCMAKGVEVWTHKDNFRLADDIQSKVLAFAFGISAEIERRLISQRTKEALARKRAEGVVIGRPFGSKNDPLKTKAFAKSKAIERYIRQGRTYAAIGRLTGMHRRTVVKFCRMAGLDARRPEALIAHSELQRQITMRHMEAAAPKAVGAKHDVPAERVVEAYKANDCNFAKTVIAMGMTDYDLRVVIKRHDLGDALAALQQEVRVRAKGLGETSGGVLA